MKSLLLLTVSANLVFSVVNVLVEEKPYTAKDSEVLYGTQVNTSYSP